MVRTDGSAGGQPDRANAGPGATLDLLGVLIEVERGLAQATTEEDILVAVARYAGRHNPASMEISYVFHDEQGEPDGTEIVAAWAQGALFAHPMRGLRFKFDRFSASSLWYSSPHDVLLVEDVVTDPRLDHAFRSLFIDQLKKRSFVLMPLYSKETERWHGILTISWTDPHAASAEEMLVYTLLTQTITAVVAGRRAIASQQEALREVSRQRIALETLVDNLPVAVLVVDVASRRPIRANRVVMDLLAPGEPPENLAKVMLEMAMFRYGAVEPLAQEQWPGKRAAVERRTVRDEIDMEKPTGKRISLDVVATPLLDENGDATSVIIMFQDIGASRRAEQERIQMQEELIRAQAAALVERSTPLIPITDEIVVTPIIGTIDSERGKGILEALLEGVSRSRARFAIIDITGVRTIDTQATGALTGVAKALRLLGVEPVLTGLRPEVARTLVDLGVDLGGIATLGTLQSGIAFASRRMGRRGL